jgi:hypothetical protein
MARSLAAIIATAALTLLTAACGGSPGSHVAQVGSSTTQSSPSSAGSGGSSNTGGPTGTQSGNSQKALAFSQCMRSHGVPKFPDPSSSNETPSGLPKVAAQELGVSSSQFQAAENACRQLLPNGGQATQSASQQTLSRLLDFARCMRSHEVTNWPDPIPVSTQAPPGAPPYTFDLNGLQGLDTRSFSPQITTAMNECFRLTHLTDSEVPWSG